MLKRIQINAKVTLGFVFLSFFVVILGILTKFSQSGPVFGLFSIYRTSFTDPMQYFRLFSHVLGSGSLNHFVSNSMIILILGPLIEEKYGSLNLLVMMLICAFVTGLAAIISPNVALLGSSGIVFMLIVLSSFVNTEKGKIPLTVILVIVFYLGNEVVNIMNDDNISRISHILGGVLGFIFGIYLNSSKSFRHRSSL